MKVKDIAIDELNRIHNIKEELLLCACKRGGVINKDDIRNVFKKYTKEVK